jgi:hypothetical protein
MPASTVETQIGITKNDVMPLFIVVKTEPPSKKLRQVKRFFNIKNFRAIKSSSVAGGSALFFYFRL